MSKRATLECKIKDAKADILRKAMERIAKQYEGHILRQTTDGHVRMMCQELSHFAVEVKIENGQLSIIGEPIDLKNAREYIEQYYTAMEIEEEFQSSSEIDENGDILLTVEVD